MIDSGYFWEFRSVNGIQLEVEYEYAFQQALMRKFNNIFYDINWIRNGDRIVYLVFKSRVPFQLDLYNDIYGIIDDIIFDDEE